ncbi:MAG: T9SS type A sorting domain-containing protein, partial [Chitinophagales bacterium]
VFVSGQEFEINGLTPGANYEYNVIALCSTTTVFLPSSTRLFNTPALNGDTYIRLFPNPVIGASKLEIITSSSFTLQVTLYDNSGKKVMIVSPTENLPAGQVIKPINTAILQSGIYHLAININGKTQHLTMIVAH